MRDLVVIEHVTLDGVMQAPGRPDEDRRGGFEHGGWAVPNTDDVMAGVMAEGMADGGPLLFGRRTYEDFYGFWPGEQDNPFTDVLNAVQKYVASTVLEEPLPWANSTLLDDDAMQAVAQLKRQPGKELSVLGSGELVRSLLQHELVDRFVLMIHPLVLGAGTRLFPEEGASAALRLVESVSTSTGVVIGTYEIAPRAGS
jgi:dihydrofolate reductase